MTTDKAIYVTARLLLQTGRVKSYLSIDEADAIATLHDFAVEKFGDPFSDARKEDQQSDDATDKHLYRDVR